MGSVATTLVMVGRYGGGICVGMMLVLLVAACAMPGMGTEEPAQRPSPSPLAATTPITLEAQLEFEAGHLQLRYPEGWESRTISGTLALARQGAALDAEYPGDDLVIFVDSTPLEEVQARLPSASAYDTQELFRISSEGPQAVGYTLSDTEAITISGQVGMAAEMGAHGGAGRCVMVVAPPYVIRIIGQATPAAWEHQRQLFDAIVASVQLVEEEEATPTPTATPRPPINQPDRTTTGPPGFVVRIGGSTGTAENRFVAARGLAVDRNGLVYLAESSQGIWVFDAEGNAIATFGGKELLDAYDVAVAPNGDLIVADYGRNDIARFGADGSLISRWGGAGDGPGEFGLLAPQRVAVGGDGSVYALDSRTSVDMSTAMSSVVRFDGYDGHFIERIPLPPGAAPGDLAVDELGNIYVTETFRGMIMKLDPQGTVMAQFGETLGPEGIRASVLDLDAAGNMIVATWNGGVLQISPDGVLLARGGESIRRGVMPQPGQFILPNGIAVGPDGNVWVSDNDGEYSAVTVLRLLSEAQVQATMEAQPLAPPLAPPTTQLTQTATVPALETSLIRQWAARARASSYYDESYSPDNVVGPPDVEGCRDSTNAWASASSDGLDTLEVDFDIPVYATQINIHQNHQPGFVARVELQNEHDVWTTVYSTTVGLEPVCPLVLQVEMEPTETRIIGARVTVDQRSGANWNEIDAVELVGRPE